MTNTPKRVIPHGYAETVDEAERVERFNSDDHGAKRLLDAHEAAAMQRLCPGSMEWATFMAAKLNLR